MWQHKQHGGLVPQYQEGDLVRVVRSVYAGRRGTIFAIHPTRERPFVVKLAEGWYVHLMAVDLAPADQDT